MATTFDVFSLGTAPDIDPTEGDGTSDNAAALVGLTYGSIASPLVDSIQTLSPGTSGFSGGGSASGYDVDNLSSNDQFRIDGGADQTMDGAAAYGATITYTDGTTATITAILFQDTSGNLYLAPQSSNNADQVDMEAKPIRSLTLDSLIANNGVLGGDRYAATYAVCFTNGTAIRTPYGDRLIDDLCVGDLVTTMDNGPQRIRWIGRSVLGRTTLLENPNLRPILIREGLLGNTRSLLVSPQHGMLLGPDGLVRAKHLAAAPRSRIRIAHGKRSVTYIHLMFDAHQIIFAENAPSESFYPGPMAQEMLAPAARAEVHDLFPDLLPRATSPHDITAAYGKTARAFVARSKVADQMRVLLQA